LHLDPGHKLFGIEGLSDEVAGALLQPPDFGIPVFMSSEHDDRNIAQFLPGFYHAQKLESVHPWHFQIAKDHIHRSAKNYFKPFETIAGFVIGFKRGCLFEDIKNLLADGFRVVHN
jgi:hypothetical protein